MPIPKAIAGPVTVLVALTITACGGGSSNERQSAGAQGGEGAKSVAANPSVKPTGNKVDINMITDSKGERYDPVDVKVDRGDSLRFLLQSGVHNVHFLPAKNPPGVKLPPMSEYLQLPGQKISYLVDFPAGRYYFQCDIHLLLGMVGYVTVDGGN
jgi:plastocyanin